jgi:hypothetical protein
MDGTAALLTATIAAMAGAVATVAAVWQVALIKRQLSTHEEVRRASFYKEITVLFLDFDKLLFENPEMRPYFASNKSVPTGIEGHRVMALAEYIVDLAETCVAAESALPELAGDWDDAFRSYYDASPALRQFWQDRGHLYPELVKTALLGPSRRPKAGVVAIPSQS